MIYFDIKEQFQDLIDRTLLEEAILVAIDHVENFDNVSLTVLVIGNEQIQSLNNQYRGINAPTDVLSFTAGYTDPETGEHYLGDVLISYFMAKRQAQTHGHPVEEEIQLLAVHGVLHLLGYDHVTESGKAIMWGLQSEILTKLGLAIEVKRDA